MQLIKKNNVFLLTLLTSGFVLSGCQVVSVKQQALGVTIANERDSILTRNKLSEASLNVLSMTGSETKKCTDQPEECVNKLEDIPEILDEQLLSTSSETYLAKAIEVGNSAACKASILNKRKSEAEQKIQQQTFDTCLEQQLELLDQSIRYSYAYLFLTKRQPQERLFDNRQVQIRDFYNQALAKLITTYSLKQHGNKKIYDQITIGKSQYTIDFSNYPTLVNRDIESLIASYNLNFSGLRSINRRDGFGAEFAVILPQSENHNIQNNSIQNSKLQKTQNQTQNNQAKDNQTQDKHAQNSPAAPSPQPYILDPLHHQYENQINPNIHQPDYLAATITAQPKNPQVSIEDFILKHAPMQINLYDPYLHQNVSINQHNYPLSANFSAPYGLWLAQNRLGISAYLSLLDRDTHLTMPHLYMLEPYNPDKKVIVLVHGLASSPEAWIGLTNDIMGDSVLREHYQVWQVFYSTNMPILESRFQIYALLNQSFAQVDQNAAAKHEAVLIGHSMGGIISRLLVSHDDITQDTLKLVKSRQLKRMGDINMINARLQMKPIDNFSRAIFISSPHRGTAYADRWFTLIARKVIRLPGAFLTAIADTIIQDDIEVKDILNQIDQGLIQNGPSDLSQSSKFMQLTNQIVPEKNVKYHSIMGNLTNSNDKNIMNDGIVPYKSSHLDGAVSEKIIKGGHSIQETPEAVLEIRRILRAHLTDLGVYQP